MTLASRITLVIVALAVATAAGIAVGVDGALRTSLASVEIDRQRHFASQLALEIEATVRGVENDVLVARNAAPLEDLFIADATSPKRAAALEQATRAFAAELTAKDHYLQIRVIGASGDGREVLRVERESHSKTVRVVPDAELQAKGRRPYVTAARALKPGDVYTSPIELNMEHGRIQVPHVPVLRAATPIVDAKGRSLGIVVINVDMSDAFERLRNASQAPNAAYLVDARGMYLVHPDHAHEFDPDFGIGNEFPDLAGVAHDMQAIAVEKTLSAGEPITLAGVPVEMTSGASTMVVTMVPSTRAEATRRARETTIVAALLAALAAAGAAYFVARSIVRPLQDMTAAAKNMLDNPDLALPIDDRSEIGILARSLHDMNTIVRERSAAVEGERRRFAQIVEATPSALLMLDEALHITLVNKNTEQLFGYPRAQLVGESISILMPPAQQAVGTAYLRAFFDNPEPDTTLAGREIEGRDDDGETLTLEAGLSRIDTADGPRLLVSVVDIAERKRALALFEQVVEATANANVIVDGSGLIVLVNRAAETLFGYARGELIGQPVECLLPEAARAQHPDHVRGFHAHPTARPMGAGRDLHGQRRDGSTVPVEIGLSPLETPEGKLTLASIVDITLRKQQENELRRSNADLEQFAYVASHDLQEPLRMVASYTELLERRYKDQLDERANKYIFYAVDGAKRMQGLVSDLLAYSRVGSRGQPLVEVDSAAVVTRVLRTINRAIQQADATVVVGELPAVLADEGQLAQLFQNLLTNAIKFTRDRTPEVHIDAERRGATWTFSVRDNGIGIAQDALERIFQMFQRLHSREEYPGSGIGLAICKRIVERHGGLIEVESEVGVGTTFRFSMQAAERE